MLHVRKCVIIKPSNWCAVDGSLYGAAGGCTRTWPSWCAAGSRGCAPRWGASCGSSCPASSRARREASMQMRHRTFQRCSPCQFDQQQGVGVTVRRRHASLLRVRPLTTSKQWKMCAQIGIASVIGLHPPERSVIAVDSKDRTARKPLLAVCARSDIRRSSGQCIWSAACSIKETAVCPAKDATGQGTRLLQHRKHDSSPSRSKSEASVIPGRQRLLLTVAAALASFVMQAGLRSPCGCPPYLLLPRVSPCARAACGTDPWVFRHSQTVGGASMVAYDGFVDTTGFSACESPGGLAWACNHAALGSMSITQWCTFNTIGRLACDCPSAAARWHFNRKRLGQQRCHRHAPACRHAVLMAASPHWRDSTRHSSAAGGSPGPAGVPSQSLRRSPSTCGGGVALLPWPRAASSRSASRTTVSGLSPCSSC